MITGVRGRCAVLFLLAVAGCKQMRASEGLLEVTHPHSALSSPMLRTLLNDFIPRFSDEVEETADRILAESNDPRIQRNALLWKSNSISACFQAAARTDSLAAFLDVWVLCRQMTHLFQSPADPPHLGNWQGLAIETSERLDQQLREIYKKIGPEMPLGEEFVDGFARQFPVRSLYFDRESLAGQYTEQVPQPTRELMHIVANLNESLSEMHKLSARYAELLPKQARWQGELMLLSSAQHPLLKEPIEDLSTATAAIDRISTTVALTPEIVAREREALRLMVAQEREVTLRDLERMRTETLRQLTLERVAVLNALREERIATTNALAEVTDQSIGKVDSLLGRRGNDLVEVGNQFFAKLTRVLLVIAAGAGALALAFLVIRKPRPVRVEPESRPPVVPQRRQAA